jgi:hypothetical protein
MELVRVLSAEALREEWVTTKPDGEALSRYRNLRSLILGALIDNVALIAPTIAPGSYENSTVIAWQLAQGRLERVLMASVRTQPGYEDFQPSLSEDPLTQLAKRQTNSRGSLKALASIPTKFGQQAGAIRRRFRCQ